MTINLIHVIFKVMKKIIYFFIAIFISSNVIAGDGVFTKSGFEHKLINGKYVCEINFRYEVEKRFGENKYIEKKPKGILKLEILDLYDHNSYPNNFTLILKSNESWFSTEGKSIAFDVTSTKKRIIIASNLTSVVILNDHTGDLKWIYNEFRLKQSINENYYKEDVVRAKCEKF